MKKVLLIIGLLSIVLFTSCSNAKPDGIYKTDNGWDIVAGGRTYSYECAPDGLYLYLDWDGNILYTLSFRYECDIYRKTVGHTGDYSATTLNFLCKNKDGKYVYVAGWDKFDGYMSLLKSIMFQTDSTAQPIYPYDEFKSYFRLMEKYTSN